MAQNTKIQPNEANEAVGQVVSKAELFLEANKKRILSETETIQTSALGNTGTTETKKKTLLGGK